MNQTEETLLDALRTLFKWKKHIIILCIITGIGAAAASLLLKDWYKSSAQFYPTNPSLTDANSLFGNSEKALSYFGGKDEVNRLMSIANSNDLVFYMVDKFDLYTVYDVQKDKPKAMSKVKRKFLGLYEVKKNEFDAISVSIEDKDPQKAYEMLQALVAKLDELNMNMSNQNRGNVIATYEANLADKGRRLAELDSILQIERQQYGIYNVEAQGEALSMLLTSTESKLAGMRAKLDVLKSNYAPRDSITFLEANIRGLETQLSSITNPDSGSRLTLSSFNEGVGKILSLEIEKEQLAQSIGYTKERYNRFQSTSQSEVSTIQIVEPPNFPDAKSRPRRSILVITAGMVAFLFGVLGALLFENYGQLDWKGIVRGE